MLFTILTVQFIHDHGISLHLISKLNKFSVGIKTKSWWNELVATGLFAVILGTFLVVLNCLITKGEEDDLEEYVQRQLTRSRSGHRLERDLETGGLTTRHHRRLKQTLQNDDESKLNFTPVTSEVVTPTTPNGKQNIISFHKSIEFIFCSYTRLLIIK